MKLRFYTVFFIDFNLFWCVYLFGLMENCNSSPNLLLATWISPVDLYRLLFIQPVDDGERFWTSQFWRQKKDAPRLLLESYIKFKVALLLLVYQLITGLSVTKFFLVIKYLFTDYLNHNKFIVPLEIDIEGANCNCPQINK